MRSDVSQSELFYKLWAWLEVHKKQVLWAAIIIVVAGIAAGFFLWQQSARAASANNALSRAMSNQMTPGQQGGSLDAILRIANEYRSTDAGARAVLLAATDLFITEKYREAQAQFERYLREHNNGPFSTQARFGVAACLEAQGEMDKAFTAYKDLVDRHVVENVTASAIVALGRIAEAQGKLEQARDFYVQIAQANLGTLSSEARMRLQNLITQHPELIPSRSAAPTLEETNAPAMDTNAPTPGSNSIPMLSPTNR